VLDQARRQPRSAKRIVTALRSLLRFLHVDGVLAVPLAGAVPSPAGHALAGLPRPRALEPGQVQAMLDSCDPATATGRRDRAVLLLLSRMGLRAGEVAGLGLDDIDWRRGEITVRGKGGRRDRAAAGRGRGDRRLPARRPPGRRAGPDGVHRRPGTPGSAVLPRDHDDRRRRRHPRRDSRAGPRPPPAALGRDRDAARRRIQVPPPGLIRRGNDHAIPYIYSGAQISAVIAAAGTLRPRFRAATYQALISLLAVSGVRIGEALSFDRGDLDADQCMLTVRDAKFGKTRLIPLHPTAAAALTRYPALRDEHHPRPADPALFLSAAGTRLRHSNVSLTFAKLTDQAGLAQRSASCRPRIHDIRHSYAVATVLGWYRDGADVAAMMPRLSTYLGHNDPKNTYWHLSAAPELMALAGDRLHAHLQGES
jgi:integrase/recombinase XerD